MYVDKKLGGVDCVQTLSRLNRTYPGKDQTFVLDFYNDIEDIQEAFEPYYKSTELEDVTDPNIIYDLEAKLANNTIFSSTDVEKFALAFFNPKGTQAAMTSAIKPAVDRYKSRYHEAVESIKRVKQLIKAAKKDKDDKSVHNYGLDLKEFNEGKSELDIFKKDLVTFIRMYEFLSQIVNYEDEDLEKLWAFIKHLIPNLKTYETKEPIDISSVELTHYKLHKQKDKDIELSGDGELPPINPGGAVPRDPDTELLSEVVGEMNALFEGDLSDDDMLNYARTVKDKMMENDLVVSQVKNNTKEQAMMGGFAERLNDAVIDSLDAHQGLATQVLGEDRIRKGFADIVYGLMLKDSQPEGDQILRNAHK